MSHPAEFGGRGASPSWSPSPSLRTRSSKAVSWFRGSTDTHARVDDEHWVADNMPRWESASGRCGLLRVDPRRRRITAQRLLASRTTPAWFRWVRMLRHRGPSAGPSWRV